MAIFAAATATGVYFYQARFGSQEEDEQVSPPYHLKTRNKPVDEIAKWQTYKNDQYGYEIQYPADYFTNVTSEGTIEFIGNQYKNQQIHYPEIYIEAITTDLTPKQWVEKYGTPIDPTGSDSTAVNSGKSMIPRCGSECKYFNVRGENDVTIGSDMIPAFWFTNWQISGGNDNTLVQLPGGVLLNIARHTSSLGEVPKDTYEKMLSTFKFGAPQK